ncbi:hypothetical protein SOVF_179410 [Spinacia oleracea]|nr:hypothetical protein SOVF_179410 [Spinacia oleracea]
MPPSSPLYISISLLLISSPISSRISSSTVLDILAPMATVWRRRCCGR